MTHPSHSQTIRLPDPLYERVLALLERRASGKRNRRGKSAAPDFYFLSWLSTAGGSSIWFG